MFRLIGLFALFPITITLTISFFVLFSREKTASKRLRSFAGVVAVLLWLEAAFFDLARHQYRLLADGDVRAVMLGWLASMTAALAHGLIDNSYFLVDLAFVFFLTLGWVRAMQAQDTSAARPAERATGTPIGIAKPQGMQ